MGIRTISDLSDDYELTVFDKVGSVELFDGASARIELGLNPESAREFLNECLRALDDIEGKL